MFKRSSLIGLSMAFLLVAMVVLMGLSGGTTLAQDAATPEPTNTPSVVGTGNIQISFWNGLTGSDGVTLIDMLSKFADENPDISVTVEMIAWATLYQKLQTAFVAGTQPDVFLLHASEVPQYGSFGVLRDLGDQYTSGGGWLPDDDISANTMSGMMYDGVIYGIPLDNHGRGLWINTAMFDAAGISTDPATAPTTYEGWVELFQKLTLDANGNNALSPDFDPENVVQWGYTVGEWPNVNFIAGLYQQGGSFLSEDGKTITVNSEAGSPRCSRPSIWSIPIMSPRPRPVSTLGRASEQARWPCFPRAPGTAISPCCSLTSPAWPGPTGSLVPRRQPGSVFTPSWFRQARKARSWMPS